MTKQEVGELMKLIVAAYPNFEVNKERAELWTEALADYDYQRAKRHLMEHIKLNRYYPTIADIRKETQADLERKHWTVYR